MLVKVSFARKLKFSSELPVFLYVHFRVDTKLLEEHVHGDAIVPTLHNSNEKQEIDLIKMKKYLDGNTKNGCLEIKTELLQIIFF